MSADNKKGIDLEALVESLQNLDFENVGGWPAPLKAAAAIVVFVVMLALGYFLSIGDLYSRLDALKRTEGELMTEYETKAFKAQNLDQYRQQLEDMQDLFGSLLSQLPKETEVPGLLEDISHTGIGSGLEFKEIKLGTEKEREFYAELPIDVTVLGDYHGFGSFVGGVAALPRIVTLEDFKIEPASKDDRSGLLKMAITAKTYRYASGKPAASGDKGGKKK